MRPRTDPGERTVTTRRGVEHGRVGHHSSVEQVRSEGDVRQSFRLAAHAAQCRTDDDVVDTHGSGTDRLRLHHRAVLRTPQGHSRSDPAPLSECAAVPGAWLIFCGIMALVISIWQYRWILRYMWSGDFARIAGMTKEGLQTPVVAIAVLLMCIGLFAFFAV